VVVAFFRDLSLTASFARRALTSFYSYH